MVNKVHSLLSSKSALIKWMLALEILLIAATTMLIAWTSYEYVKLIF